MESNYCILLKCVKEGSTENDDPYVKELSSHGISSECIPVLGFVFVNQDQLWKSLSNPDDHCGIILTSPRAVQSVHLSVQAHYGEWNERVRCDWKAKPCYSVGQATASAAEQLGLYPRGQDSGNAESLVKVIINETCDKSKPFLFPCGNMRRETIPQSLQGAGISLNGVTVYETGADGNIEKSLEEKISVKGFPHYLVFFSPSGVNFTCDLLKKLNYPLDRVNMIAIGPTTETALLEKGLTVTGTAVKPTPSDLADTINRCPTR